MSALRIPRSLRIVFAAALSVAACSDDSPESSSGEPATGEDAGQAQAGKDGKGGAGGKTSAAGSGSAGHSGAGGVGGNGSKGGSGGKSGAAGIDSAGGKGGSGGKASAAGSGGESDDAGVELEDAGPSALPEAFKISFDTTACFGTCPVYSVSLDQDGNVEFDGQEHVAKTGKSTKQVAPNAAADVYEALLAAGYFELKDAYRTEADGCERVRSDASTHNWNVEHDGKTKALSQYLGCEGVAGLDKVEAVAKLLLEKSGIADWIGSNN